MSAIAANAVVHPKDLIGYWTNIADLFSFFLVTTDLYGRQRLQTLTACLLALPQPKRLNPLDFWRGPGFVRDYLFGMPAALALMGVIIAVRLVISEHIESWLDRIGILVIIPIGLAAAGLYGGLLVSLILWAGWFALRLIGLVGRWLVQRYPMEGLMLVGGAVLFVLTRVVTIRIAWG